MADQNAGSLVYFVRSSSTDEIYELKATSQGGTVSFLCACSGAQNGSICKHRMNLLHGDVTNLIAEKSSDVLALKNLLAGTNIERSILILHDLEKEAEALKRRVASQKKVIARYMFGAD
jgi:hypothetical protein